MSSARVGGGLSVMWSRADFLKAVFGSACGAVWGGVARAADQLDGGRQAVFGRPARQCQGGPAECVEREGVAGQRPAQRVIADADRRRDAHERRGQEEIEALE